MVAESVRRVEEHTPDHINEQIRRTTESNVAWYAHHKDQIDQRLRELDEEWDIERAIEANAATISGAGLLLSIVSGRKWMIFPMLVSGFLLQHAIQGWCPPVSVLRRLGYRTPHEINQERIALKALRGDFEGIGQGENAIDEAIEAAH